MYFIYTYMHKYMYVCIWDMSQNNSLWGSGVKMKQDWTMIHSLFKLYDGYKDTHYSIFSTSVELRLSIRKAGGEQQKRSPRERNVLLLQGKGFMPIMQLFSQDIIFHRKHYNLFSLGKKNVVLLC